MAHFGVDKRKHKIKAAIKHGGKDFYLLRI